MIVFDAFRPRTFINVKCYGSDGALKWEENVTNMVTRVGAAQILTDTFKASAFTAAWYVGLVATNSTFATTDTMASHGSWTDSACYSNATRPALTLGAVSSGQDAVTVANTASPAVFNINATATVLGVFLVDNNTVSGTSGNLYGEAALATTRNVLNGDTLTVTCTLQVTAG